MGGEMSTNIGMNMLAKQYAVTAKQQKPQAPVDEGVSRKDGDGQKGQLFNEDIASITNAQMDAMAEKLGTEKKKINPTVDNLKEQLEKALADKYENSHNMLMEAFYGFKAGATNSMLNVMGADQTEIAAIRKKAYEQAKDKVQAGYERLAHAYAEFEIYAS